MNSMASLPFALLQGVGRSDTTAKIHLAEAPPYLFLMVWLIRQQGINGAAIAWCARTTLDMLLLYWYSRRQLPVAKSRWLREAALFAALTPILGVGLIVQSPLQKVLLTSILLISLVALAWHWTVASERRGWIGILLKNQ